MSNVNAALQRYLDRLNGLEDVKQSIFEDMKQVLAEAKAEGFEPKILRKLAAARRTEGGIDTMRKVVNLSDNLDLLGGDDE